MHLIQFKVPDLFQVRSLSTTVVPTSIPGQLYVDLCTVDEMRVDIEADWRLNRQQQNNLETHHVRDPCSNNRQLCQRWNFSRLSAERSRARQHTDGNDSVGLRQVDVPDRAAVVRSYHHDNHPRSLSSSKFVKQTRRGAPLSLSTVDGHPRQDVLVGTVDWKRLMRVGEF